MFNNFFPSTPKDSVGFGTIKGVYIPNVLMMFGVILFLRLGVITANVGVSSMALIICSATLILILTSLSLTSIVTNMKVGGGGVYYILSRSLGIEIGGSIGILLYISQIISIALCTTGFALSFNDLFPQYPLPLIEAVTLGTLTVLSFISADLALKTQFIILCILLASFVSIFFGSASNITTPPALSFFPGGLSYWQAFSLFFPAVTGIEAGIAMSGTLKNPAKSLSLGTFFSLLTCFAIYLSLALFMYKYIPLQELKSNPFVLLEYAYSEKLVIFGIWAATLSSVLGSLLGAPRMLQAISFDGILPEIFAKEFGKYKEPRYALVITCVIALFLAVYTTIDQIIPILAMICLISYGFINLVAGLSELINNPGWRPRVRTPWWISLLGSFFCFGAMLMIDPGWTFGALVAALAVYIFVSRKNIPVDFEDIRDSIFFYICRWAVYKLSSTMGAARNWHPQLLTFVSSPKNQRNMLHLSDTLTRQSGLLTVASILPESWADEWKHEMSRQALESYYEKIGISCLTEVGTYETSFDGMNSLIKSYGFGPLSPNTIVIEVSEDEPITDETLEILRTAESMRKNILLYRENRANETLFKKRFRKKHKRIDVWWDSDYRGNFELMLSFITSLKDDFVWRSAHTNLQAVIATEDAKDNLLEYINEFIYQSRLTITPQIHVDEKPINVGKYSEGANLCFCGLNPLSSYEEDSEFMDSIDDMLKNAQNVDNMILVISNDQTDHREIYH